MKKTQKYQSLIDTSDTRRRRPLQRQLNAVRILGLVFMGLLIVIVAAWTPYLIAIMDSQTAMYARDAKTNVLLEATGRIVSEQRELVNAAAAGDSTKQSRSAAEIQSSSERLTKELQDLPETIMDEDFTALVALTQTVVKNNAADPAEAKAVLDSNAQNEAQIRELATKISQENRTGALEIRNASRQMISVGIVILIVLPIILLVIGWVVTYRIRTSINKSLASITNGMQSMAAGDLKVRATSQRNDEIGDVAGMFNRAQELLGERMRQTQQTASEVEAYSQEVTNGVEQVRNTTKEMTQSVAGVSEAANEIAITITTMAAGAEQMGSSIRDISSNATEATHIAQEGAQVAKETTSTVEELQTSSREIGEVVATISKISTQTNMLGLNATIEAARTGEEGKGFVVVASEVKDLAGQTSDATDKIAAIVKRIQGDATAAGEAMREINQVIMEICEMQETIGAAVEEQTATTADISKSIAEASNGAQAISNRVEGFAAQIGKLETKVEGARESVEALGEQAEDMRQQVGAYSF